MKKAKSDLPDLKYKDESPYFEKQPPGTRVASIEDFSNLGKIIGKPYLIHSERFEDIYEAHRTRTGFTEANDFMLFLKRGRIYVFEKK